MLNDPLTLVMGLVGLGCELKPDMGARNVCRYLDAASSILQLIDLFKEIMNAKDIFSLKGEDSCKAVLEQVAEVMTPLTNEGTPQPAGNSGGVTPS